MNSPYKHHKQIYEIYVVILLKDIMETLVLPYLLMTTRRARYIFLFIYTECSKFFASALVKNCGKFWDTQYIIINTMLMFLPV